MIEIRAEIEVVPKQRPRAGKSGVYTPEKTKLFERALAWIAKKAMANNQVFKTPVRVQIEYWRSRAVGDIDNAAKSILDGLNGIVYTDDQLVSELFVVRHECAKKPKRAQIVKPLIEQQKKPLLVIRVSEIEAKNE
jgi:crossover junction endodeoxyribonuclease RusA